MKNRQTTSDEKAYCDIKKNGIEAIRHDVTARGYECLAKALCHNYPELANRDADIALMRLCACSKNFTKSLPIKRIEKLIAAVKSKDVIGDTSFYNDCQAKITSYIEMCRVKMRKAKRIKVGVGIVCTVFAVLAAVGIWHGDRQGLFYGTQSITYSADGAEYTQTDAIKYNHYVEVNVPSKIGYDAIGIIDANTQKKLFDSNGRSLSVVSRRDLSDYNNCALEVVYAPHIYSAQVMTSASVAGSVILIR